MAARESARARIEFTCTNVCNTFAAVVEFGMCHFARRGVAGGNAALCRAQSQVHQKTTSRRTARRQARGLSTPAWFTDRFQNHCALYCGQCVRARTFRSARQIGRGSFARRKIGRQGEQLSTRNAGHEQTTRCYSMCGNNRNRDTDGNGCDNEYAGPCSHRNSHAFQNAKRV